MSPAAYHLAILRAAGVLVPVEQRSDWLAEWQSELWHVRRNPHGTNVAAFCIGAFRDAFWLWRDDPCPERFSLCAQSPARCLAWLAALATLCLGIGLLLPGARKVLFCSLYPRNLVMLNPASDGDPGKANGFFDPYPSVSLERFEALKALDGDQFTGLAFYVPTGLQVHTPGGKRNLLVARATPDLFRLLNIPIPQGHSGVPVLLLTSGASRKYFHGNLPYGVIASNLWNLPAGVDGWLIEDQKALSVLPAKTLGFVVGRLRYGYFQNSQFHYIRLGDRSLTLLWLVLPVFAFSCVLFTVMASGSPGGHLRRIGRRRALFLAAKILLILPLIAFASLDLACLGGSVTPILGNAVMLASFLAARWIIADQRNRCPVCLRVLSNPVRIGESSRILLEWHGTELMCDRGHGLLYVPEWPALWSARQRWMGLGVSWSGLFP